MLKNNLKTINDKIARKKTHAQSQLGREHSAKGAPLNRSEVWKTLSGDRT